MIFQSQRQPGITEASSFSPPARNLQRKCACGGIPGPSGECAECKRKRLALQTKLVINQPGDRYEQEAERVADAIVRRTNSVRPTISSLGNGALQREGPGKPKTEGEKYKEAAKKVGEAFLKTPPGKEIEKKAEELGDAFISTLPGKIITGAAVTGAIATLAATHKELPIGIPEIPLDRIKPGLKMKITYEGPVDKPSKVMVGFSIPLGGKSGEKKHGPTESEKRQSETARMAADQAKFREGLKSDEEKAEEQRRIDANVTSRMLRPDQLTPRTSPLSFGVAGEQLGFHPGAPAPAPRSSLSPWVPDFTLTGGTSAGEPKKKEEETIQRKASSDREVSGAPPIVDEVLQSSGEPLDPATRRFMEERFGYDFSRVRIHAGARAAQSSRSINALAYTVGRDVVFGEGQYAPTTVQGRKLLAHELAHTAQQGSADTLRRFSASTECPDECMTCPANGVVARGCECFGVERPDSIVLAATRIQVVRLSGGATESAIKRHIRQANRIWKMAGIEIDPQVRSIDKEATEKILGTDAKGRLLKNVQIEPVDTALNDEHTRALLGLATVSGNEKLSVAAGTNVHSLVVYYVPEFNRCADDDKAIGCAFGGTHGGRFFVLIEKAAQATALAHELGHMWGNEHVSNNRNVMFERPAHGGLDPDQIRTARQTLKLGNLRCLVSSAPSADRERIEKEQQTGQFLLRSINGEWAGTVAVNATDRDSRIKFRY